MLKNPILTIQRLHESRRAWLKYHSVKRGLTEADLRSLDTPLAYKNEINPTGIFTVRNYPFLCSSNRG